MNKKITIFPSRTEFTADAELTLLQSALQNHIVLEHSCGTGQCGACKTKLLSGEIKFDDKFNVLSEQEQSQGVFLSCTAHALSDLQIESEYFPELADIQKKTVPCKIDSLHFPVANTAILILRLPPTADFKYLPGQYIDLTFSGISRSYSIACATVENNLIELHIRKVEDGIFSDFVFNEFKVNQLLRIQGPIGTFFIRNNEKPVIFLAGGTGFAPVKAMVESLIASNDQRDISIYWGARTGDDIYTELPVEWSKNYSNIKSYIVVSDDESWAGRRGFVHQAVLDDFSQLNEYVVYACGSSAMINIAKKTFIEKGLNEHSFIADAFLPATAIA
jgi:2-polyprenylphenol hydroxylase and related flavodoxin oxidoreductases